MTYQYSDNYQDVLTIMRNDFPLGITTNNLNNLVYKHGGKKVRDAILQDLTDFVTTMNSLFVSNVTLDTIGDTSDLLGLRIDNITNFSTIGTFYTNDNSAHLIACAYLNLMGMFFQSNLS